MFATSQDLFYIVLSLSVLWFTVFLCWLLYQAARVLRNANRIIENLTNKLEIITDAVEFIREKVDGVSSKMGVMSSMLAGIIEKIVIGKLSSQLGSLDDEEEIVKAPRTKKKKTRK